MYTTVNNQLATNQPIGHLTNRNSQQILNAETNESNCQFETYITKEQTYIGHATNKMSTNQLSN